MFQKIMLLAGVVGGIIAASSSHSNVLTVPGQYPSIQGAIYASTDGDTVLVANGTYTGPGNTNLDFVGKAILVTSEFGPDSCIIDCQSSGRGFYFHSGESPSADLCGFKIINGYAPLPGGGGIYCEANSNPTIRNNTISGNTIQPWGSGGGILCSNSSPLILDNTISGSPTGSGLICYSNSNPLINGNIISGNYAAPYGYGGGIFINSYSHPIISNNIICENYATYGGAIAVWNGSTAIITHSTIVANDASVVGSIITQECLATVANCIIWGNGSPWQMDPDVQATFSCVQGGFPGTGNINADPLFVSGPDGNYYLSQMAAGQYQQSPCVNAGDPASPLMDGSTRTDGAPDLGVVDMGYHYLAFAASSSIELALTPFNPPIIIPIAGGSFAFVITIDNNTDSVQIIEGWTQLQLPNGHQVPIMGPISIALAPNFSLFRVRDQVVPANAPAGNYTYWGYVGTYPSIVVDSDSFSIAKSGSNRDWLGGEGWVCSGESFDAWEQPDSPANSKGAQPCAPTLCGANPNPFNPTTAISYQLSANSFVSLRVYDTAGRLVQTLVDGWREAGTHEVNFNASSLSSGIYLARLTAGGFTQTQKLILLK